MKNPKITLLLSCFLFFCCIISVKSQDRYLDLSLFVKQADAIIVHDTIGGHHTWYTWKKALQDEIIPGQAQGHMWCTLLTNDQTIIKLDSATWELFVKVTMLGDDGEKINISYHSFDVPIVNTDSNKYDWMKDTSYEAGGYFLRGGYSFRIKVYEQRQDFRFKRITKP
jgi:hypothetical protein